MAIDPRLAAQQAQAAAAEAAAAAKAAADAAEAEQQARAVDAAALETRATSLASGGLNLDTSTRDVLEDTGATLGGVVESDAVGAHDLAAAQDTALAGTSRESLLDLPSIGSLGSVGGGGLTSGLPDLGASFQSGGGGISKSSIMSGDPNLAAALASTPFYSDAGPADAGDAGDAGAKKGGYMRIDNGEITRFNPDTGEVEVEPHDGGVEGEDTTHGGAFHADAGTTVEGGAVKTGKSIWDSIVDFFGGDDDDSAATTDGGTDGGTTGADAGAGGDVPAEDAPVVLPKGWVDTEGILGGRLGVGGAVGGAKGGDPDGGDIDTTGNPGPEGTTVNPSPEGNYSNIRTSVDRVTAVDWVGQPAGPDDDKAPLPAELGVIAPGPGPEVINPGSGDAETADAEAQASTAYAAPTDASNGAAADDAGSMADPLAAMAEDEPAKGGRDFGQSHGQGRGGGGGRTEESSADE
jgi:hypothetical protein